VKPKSIIKFAHDKQHLTIPFVISHIVYLTFDIAHIFFNKSIFLFFTIEN